MRLNANCPLPVYPVLKDQSHEKCVKTTQFLDRQTRERLKNSRWEADGVYYSYNTKNDEKM